jgi:hypothetical protein
MATSGEDKGGTAPGRSAVKEVLRFLFSARRIWLGMFVLLCLLLGIILLLGQTSALAPFVYGVF